MALNRWSLDQLLGWIGTLALLVLGGPLGLYLTQHASTAEQRSLAAHGQVLASALARQIVDPMLLHDRLALLRVLRKSALADDGVRYLCAEDASGRVVAHTFETGCPADLARLWHENGGRPVSFRTKEGPLMDIPAPILSGELGTLHVGMSRARVVNAAQRTMWMVGAALAGSTGVVVAGARVVAARVSRPLRRLEAQVSRLPREAVEESGLQVSGTREVVSLATCFTDMLRRLRSLERERALTMERMVHAERLAALGELAAGLAHEINNPLDGMLECLRYLSADPEKGPRAAKYYPMLAEGLQRISLVMNEMLAFTRSGRKVCLEACPVEEIVESSVLLAQPRLEERHVRLTWERTGGCVCSCDRQGLAQAVLNLMLNAAEAAAKSADPEVRIQAHCDEQQVYLVVEDSGPGVPEEIRERIFDAFFTTKPRGKGTGLGLSVSRQLIRAVGGDVELSPQGSGLGGARFVIRLARVAASGCAHG